MCLIVHKVCIYFNTHTNLRLEFAQHTDQRIPADMILLRTTETEGEEWLSR